MSNSCAAWHCASRFLCACLLDLKLVLPPCLTSSALSSYAGVRSLSMCIHILFYIDICVGMYAFTAISWSTNFTISVQTLILMHSIRHHKASKAPHFRSEFCLSLQNNFNSVVHAIEPQDGKRKIIALSSLGFSTCMRSHNSKYFGVNACRSCKFFHIFCAKSPNGCPWCDLRGL